MTNISANHNSDGRRAAHRSGRVQGHVSDQHHISNTFRCRSYYTIVYVQAYLRLGLNLTTGTTPSAAPKEIFIVPYQQNDQFTGRVTVLDKIAATLWNNNLARLSHRIVLHGLGGVGKTQIALQYAHIHRDRYGKVFWVKAVNKTAVLASFGDIGKRTGSVSNIETLKPTEIAARVLSWLNTQEQWLLVFDNLEDDSVVEGYLPHPSSLKHILITTRDRHSDISAEKVEVDVLELNDAIDFLLSRSETSDTTVARQEAVKIVTLLGNLPLAIEQAAAYIRQVSRNIFNFVQRYKDAKILFDKKPQKGIRDYKDSVATTWSMSFNQIETVNSDASTLLRLMAFLDPDGIPIEYLEAGLGRSEVDGPLGQFLPDSERFDRALSDLERFSLIKRQGTAKESTVVMHRLVQDVVLDEMSPKIRSALATAVIELSNSAFPSWNTLRTIDNEKRLRCRKYQYQVLALLSKVQSVESTMLGNITYRMGRFFLDEGKNKEARELIAQALDGFERVVNGDIRLTIRIKGHLGWAVYHQKQYEEAILILEPTRKVAETSLGTEDPDTLEIMENLAMTYESQTRVEDAISLQEEVLEIRRRVAGEQDIDTLTAKSNLADFYQYQGRDLTVSMTMEEEILEGRMLLLGPEHPDTLVTMNNLAIKYGELGRLDDELRLQEKVLVSRTRLFGLEHPVTLVAMSNLGITYRQHKNLEAAEKLQVQVLETRTRLAGEEHPDTLWAMNSLALTYRREKKLDQARQLNEKFVETKTRSLREGHPDTLTEMANLAVTYFEWKDYENAAKLEEKVLKERLRLKGTDSRETLVAMNNLVCTYHALGKFEEAFPLAKEAFENGKRVLGADNAYTKESEALLNLLRGTPCSGHKTI
jgi:tetratricopeptide (TPR) repeat protein